jgi:hypothetical protein
MNEFMILASAGTAAFLSSCLLKSPLSVASA